MPLVHKTQPVPRAKAATEGGSSNGSHNDNPEMVWKIRFTTERFREYSDYLERLDFYRQRIFSCRTTGRGHLTYEEALTSEFQSSLLSKKFPEAYTEPLLRKLHGLQLEPDSAVTMLHNFLNTSYFPGEHIYVPASVISMPNTPPTTEIELEIVSFNESAQSVQASVPTSTETISTATTSAAKSDTANRKVYTVPIAKIVRKASQSLPSDVLRNKIWCSASRGSFKDAPWVVHDTLLAKMTKPPTLGAAANKALEAKEPKDGAKSKRKRESLEEDMGRASEEGTKTKTSRAANSKALAEPKSKKKKVAEESTEARTKVHKVSDEASVAPDDLKIERSYLSPAPKPVPVTKPAKSSKMAVDGEEEVVVFNKVVMASPGPQKQLAYPVAPSGDLDAPQGCVEDLLMLMSHLSAFHETLTLTIFPTEDLVAALNYPEYSSLLGEVHHRLLRHLNAHNNHLPRMSAKIWEPNLIYYLKSKLQLFGHVSLFAKLKRDGYFSLSFAQKLQILLFVAHMVSSARIIERPATDYPTKKANIIAASQMATIELKRQYKTQKAKGIVKGEADYLSASDLKTKIAEEELKLEEDLSHLAAIRTKPLGQDRYHNTYWWFGKNAWRSAHGDAENAPVISKYESSIIVEYHDGNIDWEADPTLDEYASDEETRHESIIYLNTALPGSSAAALALEVEDELLGEEEGNGEGKSNRRNRDEPIEYDHNGRPVRRAKLNVRYAGDSDQTDSEEDDDWGSDNERAKSSSCEICHTSKDLHKMLLCDSCDKAHHMYCLRPAITRIPDGDWFCPVCSGLPLPPPPSEAAPINISTRLGQQRLLEQQLAAVKREEEALQKKTEEERRLKEQEDLKAKIAAETAERIAAQRAIDDAAIAAALKMEAESASSAPPQRAEISPKTTTHNVSTDVTPAAATQASSGDKSEIPTVQASSSMDVDPTPPSEHQAHQPDHPASGAHYKNRQTFDHLLPAPKRVKDMTPYQPVKSKVRWAYYETPEEVKLLLDWLDDRGAREKKLKQSLTKKRSAIVGLMEKRAEQWLKAHHDNSEIKRATRQSHPKPAQEPFQTYVNKLAEQAR